MTNNRIQLTQKDSGEAAETQTWLDFALACEYVPKKIYEHLTSNSEEVGQLLTNIIENPKQYRRKNS